MLNECEGFRGGRRVLLTAPKEIGGGAPPYIEGNPSTAFAARLIPQYESHIRVTKETIQFVVVNLTKEIPHSNRVTKERTLKLSQHVSHQGTVRIYCPGNGPKHTPYLITANNSRKRFLSSSHLVSGFMIASVELLNFINLQRRACSSIQVDTIHYS